MKNSFGTSVSVTLFGESHGAQIGAVLDGMAPGIPVNREFISSQLRKRAPVGKISTPRHESDEFTICSGVFGDKTTGTPICITIPNQNTKSEDYESTRWLARPGHADYTSNCKYHGFEDYRGGGHFSGRITAPLVAVGAIALSALSARGIKVGTHIKSVHGVCDRGFKNIKDDIDALSEMDFAVLDGEKGALMRAEIEKAGASGDSVGGVLQTAVYGMPAGIGEPWFDTVESMLSHALFGIPGIKGVSFGDGFGLSQLLGSEANDGFRMAGDRIVTETNRNGGINGGITNGMPIVFDCAVKPTPSISKEQKTVNFSTRENTSIGVRGRHDPAIIHRARVVVDSVAGIVLCDLLAARYGTDYFCVS